LLLTFNQSKYLQKWVLLLKNNFTSLTGNILSNSVS